MNAYQVFNQMKPLPRTPIKADGYFKPKTCPFCGGEAQTYGHVGYYVACTRCGAESDVFEKKLHAVHAWNRRV